MPFTPMNIRPDVLNHLVIRASAGSGKTYQLVSRYLQLVVAGAPLASILASTFTRLAAGQIRDKILMALAEAARDDKKRTEFAGRLGVTRLSRDDVLDLLAHLAKNLHRMQIRTLDSFFAAIVRGFAVELDLPLGATIIDEALDTQLRNEAIRLMLDESKPQQLVDLLRNLIQDQAERGVCERIITTVTSLHALLLEAPVEAWDNIASPAGRLGRSQIIDAIAALEACDIPDDRKALCKARDGDVESARTQNWREFVKGGIAGNLAAGNTRYGRTTIDDYIIEAYLPLVKHAKALIIGRVRNQTLATRDLLTSFDQHYRAVKNANHAITFGDLADAMARAESLGKMNDICFRIDATLRHMLLDEFQDTSIPQWRALEPMAKEIVAERPPERSFFCVGDVKQSIYGWRSAAPEVLDALPQLLQGDDGTAAIETKSLAKSWRSSPVIMEAVNKVFGSLETNPALSEHPNAATAWSKAFERHSTTKDFPGRVELRIMPRIEGRSHDRFLARFNEAARLVAELHHASPRMTIAVLSRTRKGVARMLYELGPNQLDIPVTGHGGGPLTDAPAVNVILDLLRLADHPDDTISAFNVARSPAGSMIDLTDYKDDRQRRIVAQTIRRSILNDGCAATIAGWVADFAEACDQRELGRLVQLVELAGAHDSQPSLRTGDFIDRVEGTPVPTTQPAPVQVMTIHQSKGLEFDAVVLPELEWTLVGAPPPVVFERAGETGPITRICCFMNAEVRAFVPDMQPLFDRYDRRTARESLSLLYVAITRAKRGLYMLIDPPKINKNGEASKDGLRTAAGLVRCALSPGGVEPETVAYEFGTPDWMNAIEADSTSTVPADAPQIDNIRLAKPVRQGTRGLKAQSASQLADVDELSAPIMPVNREARERGIVIHTLFEQIEWLEDFTANATSLLPIARRKAKRHDEPWVRARVHSFLGALKHAAVNDALSCNGRDRSRLEVHREHPFARIVNDGVQQGMIDRLVVERDIYGKAISASIVDFKTDAITAAECDACAQHYLKQMDTYREVAAVWLGIEPRQITRSLLFVGPGVRIDL